jgi:pentatricopeptide repeat protein
MRRISTLILLALVLISAGYAVSALATPTPSEKGEYWCRGMPVKERRQTAARIRAQIETAAQELGLQPILPEIIIEDYFAVVVSPRHKIELKRGEIIYKPLTLEEIAEIEADPTSIFPSLYPGDWSVSIIPGLGYQHAHLNPAAQRPEEFVVEVIAQTEAVPYGGGVIRLGAGTPSVMTRVAIHEWGHALLEGSPLANASLINPDAQRLEELVVEVIAKEIAKRTCAKYGEGCEFPLACEEEQLLRPKIDQLLSEGKVEEAETLLEEMRSRLCPTDWCPYRVNQASFAVMLEACKDYRDEGGDWKRMQRLRAQYRILKEFLNDIKQVESHEDFLKLCEEHGINPDE